MTTEPTWRTSSYSGEGNCIEVADHAGHVLVRDTKQEDSGPLLRFTPAAWRRFARELEDR